MPGARIDIWQANTKGFYDVQQPGIQSIGNGRGLFTADEHGEFYFRSVIPSYYPIPTDGPVGDLLHATDRHPNRPAHIHFIVAAPGYRELTTHIFVGGSEYIDSDAVFAVKESLIAEFSPPTRIPKRPRPRGGRALRRRQSSTSSSTPTARLPTQIPAMTIPIKEIIR